MQKIIANASPPTIKVPCNKLAPEKPATIMISDLKL